jgi:hypothetical protein
VCKKRSFFFYISPLSFAKIYDPQKDLQNYTSNVVGGGDRDLPPCPTAVGARGPVCFQKIVIFYLNLDEGKLYMKIVTFNEIYNFVVQSFCI